MPINSFKDCLQITYKPLNIPTMKCEKARTLFPVLAAKRLQGSEKIEVESHLTDCPSCATALEKTRKLQALLSLKRLEKPDEFFFRNYVPEFHRRLYTDVVQERSRSFWTKLREAFSFEIQGAFALQSVAAILLLGILGFGYHLYSPSAAQKINTSPEVAQISSASAVSGASVVEVDSRFNELVLANPSGKSSIFVLDRVAYKPSNHGPVVLQF
jgi:hypothetical protein